jgi:MoaD family protein
MAAQVTIPTPFRTYTEGERRLTTEGRTVGEVLAEIGARYPGLRSHLFGETGELRRFVNVFVNEANVRDLEGVTTGINDGDQIAIVPSIAGG